MPQLARGGKYVFGWSKVGKTGKIVIPSEAMEEYKLHDWDRVILMSGSRRSGGFGVTTPSLLRRSPLSSILSQVPGLGRFQMPEGRAVTIEGRAFCWATIQEGGRITLPAATLREYEIREEDLLLTVKGSHLALGFALKGPLVEEALEHRHIEVFE
jgi:bifunctional DNA-binding transcriptional regulator/antitoxin component of YhaV-PrlF toxin-antitoxin module